MFENQTFEIIVERMLGRISNDIDKREGSIIYDASAMTAKELQEIYIALDSIILETFPETASRTNLIRRAAEYGVFPYEATKAILKGEFNIDIPIGSRFSLDDLNYVAIQRISPGVYQMECETPGTIGNTRFGELIPIEYIDGLTFAELTELLIPGEDEEETEVFRRRFFLERIQVPYGGNRDDYYQKVMSIQGVGGVKLHRTPNGGGTVGVTIIDSEYNPPTQSLIEKVQTALDPIPNNGEGLGLAPYGHRVTVNAAEVIPINFECTVVLSDGTTLGQIQQEVEDVLGEYLLSLRKSWMDNDVLVVRIAQAEARIIDIEGVIDISNTLINGIESNQTLLSGQIPVLGTVTLNE